MGYNRYGTNDYRECLKELKREAKELGLSTTGFRVHTDSQGEVTVSNGRFESSTYEGVTAARCEVIQQMIDSEYAHVDF